MPRRRVIKRNLVLKLCKNLAPIEAEAMRLLRHVMDAMETLAAKRDGRPVAHQDILSASQLKDGTTEEVLSILTEAGLLRYQRPADRRQEGWILKPR